MLHFKVNQSLYIQHNRSIVWLVLFNMQFDWPVVSYELFELPNIADMGVYYLFIKFSIVCYFNILIFKVVYSMSHLFIVSLLMPYCFLILKFLYSSFR